VSTIVSFTDEEIVRELEAHGCSWQDYFLVGSPASICRFTRDSGLSALLIENEDLANAAVEFLRRQGAQVFESISDVMREFSWDGSIRAADA
jgi:hypothetical protein